MSKKALGKGIGALIQQKEDSDGASRQESQLMVPLVKLFPNPNQPRKEFNEEHLQELCASIKEKGVLQPLLVEKSGFDEYMIIAGERRFRAARMAGLIQVPVIVKKFSTQEKLEIGIIENIQREDLNPMEEAEAYKHLMELGSIGQEEVADRVGKKRATIANALRLLKLPDEMKQAVSAGLLTSGHAKAILSLKNPADQKKLFVRIIKDGISVRAAEEAAAEMNAGKKPGIPKEQELIRTKPSFPELNKIEESLIEALGTKVSVKGSYDTGKIEVSYFSMEDLERICEILGVIRKNQS